MKLREIKTTYSHYFEDEQNRKQGEFKDWYESGQLYIQCFFVDGNYHGGHKRWYPNGQQYVICHYQDGKFHGEFKEWDRSGKLVQHAFDVDGIEIVDFLKNPKLYPSTPEERAHFSLKYNIGDASFIGNSDETN